MAAVNDYDLHQQSSFSSHRSASAVMQSDDLLVKLWSTIHRLEDDLKFEKQRSHRLTEQVRSLSDSLERSSSLVEEQLRSPSAASSPSAKSFDLSGEIDANGMRPEDQKAALDALSAIADIDKPFPTHGVPLWHVLHALSGVQENRVFTVRRIQKLGFDSAMKLREYFSMWGEVSNLLILHRQAKASSPLPDGDGVEVNNNSAVRVRPPSVGFVVMEDPNVVERILAQPKHVICGHTCDVQKFEHKHKLLLPPPGLGAEPTTVLTTPKHDEKNHSKKDVMMVDDALPAALGDPFGVWDGGVDMFAVPGYGTTTSFDYPDLSCYRHHATADDDGHIKIQASEEEANTIAVKYHVVVIVYKG